MTLDTALVDNVLGQISGLSAGGAPQQVGDVGEMWGGYRGGMGEMWGRCGGDVGGSCGGDMGEI